MRATTLGTRYVSLAMRAVSMFELHRRHRGQGLGVVDPRLLQASRSKPNPTTPLPPQSMDAGGPAGSCRSPPPRCLPATAWWRARNRLSRTPRPPLACRTMQHSRGGWHNSLAASYALGAESRCDRAPPEDHVRKNAERRQRRMPDTVPHPVPLAYDVPMSSGVSRWRYALRCWPAGSHPGRAHAVGCDLSACRAP